eukprot:2994302-Rhodomonas_salina.1
MRSDNIESVWLNHVSQSVIGDESVGAREFKGMRTICTSGKVNRCGLVQETGLIPNSEKWLCGILHVAVLHFLKWTLEGKPYPNMARRQWWYGTFLIFDKKTIDSPKQQ